MAKKIIKKRTLVIAEKPSVAKDIAAVLGASGGGRRGDVLENDDYIVTSALGHLVELPMPEDIDQNWRPWNLGNLPIVPKKFPLKASEKTKDRFEVLKKFLNSEEVGEVINACDSGREGELIFSYIYELSGSTKPFRRLWMVSMTGEGIRGAFNGLRSAEEMWSLQCAARCRSEADWLVGINGTRAITASMLTGRAVSSVGRVQTPTLSMIVDRGRSIRDFKPVPFWRILGKFSVVEGGYEGVYRAPVGKNGEETGRDRIFDGSEAQRIFEEVLGETRGTVTEKKKRSKSSPPRLYDLTSLQRDANNRFGFPAAMTLKIAQALYETHKVITYPRTDAKALPEDYGPVCKATLDALDGSYKPLAEKILMEHGIRSSDRKIFNNGEISDHFAIIPTPQRPRELGEPEQKIYDTIVRRFLAVFYPPAEYDVTTRTTTVKGHAFHSEGRILVVPGWLEVYGREQQDRAGLLPRIGKEDGVPPSAAIGNMKLSEEETKPLPHYTEATLLSAMETAGRLVEDDELAEAMREKGLGTPATRAQIIDNLISARYVDRSERALLATQKAERLMDVLSAMEIDGLKNPALTGEWEFKLRKMEQGKFLREEFMEEIQELTQNIVKHIKDFDEMDPRHCHPSKILSPSDGQPLLETMRGYVSTDRSLNISRVLGGRELAEEEVAILLREGRVGPFEDFRSRAGRPFKATVVLEKGRAKLAFDGDSQETVETARRALEGCDSAPLCDCPTDCGGKVYFTELGYICSNFPEKKCPLRIGKKMLGHDLSNGEIVTLLEEGQSPLIENFVSNRTGKMFKAHLQIDKSGKITFKFPQREPKKAPESTEDGKKGRKPKVTSENDIDGSK
ncbi:MAG: topoisomerase C-terminal repeat-containing protein [Puniceicoccales bacterium]|jgi:DNA topoisomerase-3|nr:topoisomerase C-terminal repeat-containing protein [Puniceicoccales bacterium]